MDSSFANFSTSQKNSATGNQLRRKASRSHAMNRPAHLHEDSSDEDEPEAYSRRAGKRGQRVPRPFDQFAEQPRRVNTPRLRPTNNEIIHFSDGSDSDESSYDEALYEKELTAAIVAEEKTKFGSARYLACLTSNVRDSSGSSDSLANIDGFQAQNNTDRQQSRYSDGPQAQTDTDRQQSSYSDGPQAQTNTDRQQSGYSDGPQAQTNTDRPQSAYIDGQQSLANADRPQAIEAHVDVALRLASTGGSPLAVRPPKEIAYYIWEKMSNGLIIRRLGSVEEYLNQEARAGEFAENSFINFDYDG